MGVGGWGRELVAGVAWWWASSVRTNPNHHCESSDRRALPSFCNLGKTPTMPSYPFLSFYPHPHSHCVKKPSQNQKKKKRQIPLSPFLWHPIIHMTPSLKNPSSSSYGLSKIGKRTINPFQYKPPSMLTHTWLFLQSRRKACLPYPTKLSFFPKIFSFLPLVFFSPPAI